MNAWNNNINTGELDYRYVQIMEKIDGYELSNTDKILMWRDLRDTFENRLKLAGEKKKKWWQIF